MANCAVLASGTGTNFEKIQEALSRTDHELVCLICDRKGAPVLKKADHAGIPSFHVSYKGRTRGAAELEIISHCRTFGADLIALAGFMKLLTPAIIDAFPARIINIHPTLLPRFPGVDGIERSFVSADRELGITIHQVNYDLDAGPILLQKSFTRAGNESLEAVESKIHSLEHTWYPKVIIDLLNAIEQGKN